MTYCIVVASKGPEELNKCFQLYVPSSAVLVTVCDMDNGAPKDIGSFAGHRELD